MAGEAVAGPAVALVPARRPWWRWLLWALLLLLLLLLLLFWLYRCAEHEGAVNLPFGSPATERPQAERPRDDSIIGRTRRFFGLEEEVPDGVAVPGQVVQGQVVPGEGKVEGEGEATVPPSDQVVPGETPKEGVPPGSEDQKPGDQKPEKAGDQAAEPPQPPKPEDAQTPKPDQPKPPKGQKSDAPKQDGSKDQPKDQPRDQNKDQNQGKGQSLQIPPDAAGKSGAAGFLGGEWKSDAGLVDQATQQPLQQSYRFDKEGKGEVVIRRADGVECRAGAQARMQGGKLSIDEAGDPTCPDGHKYAPLADRMLAHAIGPDRLPGSQPRRLDLPGRHPAPAAAMTRSTSCRISAGLGPNS